MAVVTRIPRRRGSLCGLLLVLLGAWGALGPFVGPYFKFAYTPDKAWAYNSGRLYLSILPGVAAVLGGLLVLGTRSRAAGMLGGLLAAAGGAWFIAGQGIVSVLLKRPSIKAGVPVTRGGAAVTGSVTNWQFLEMLGFFIAVGVLIVFFGALALGRFSMTSHRDVVDPAEYGDDYLDPADADPAPAAAADDQYAAATDAYPAGSPRPFPGEEPTQAQPTQAQPTQAQPTQAQPTQAQPTQAQPTQAQERLPASSTGSFPSPSGQFPASSTSQFPASRAPFEPSSSPE
jgi:hypothetical protein